MVNLISQAIEAKTPQDVQEVLEALTFRIPNPYEVQSAVSTLRTGEANCYEAALVASHLMGFQSFPSRVLILSLPKKGYKREGHAVYLFKKGNSFYTLGKSSMPELQGRNHPVSSVEELVCSYSEGFQKNGLTLDSFAVIELPGSEWRVSRDPVTVLCNVLATSADYHQL